MPARILRHSAAISLVLLLTACGGGDAPSATPAADPSDPAVRDRRPTSRAQRQRPAPDDGPCPDEGLGPEPDAGGLRAFVGKRAGQVRDCYQRALKRDASCGGKATIQFTIERCGQLSAVRVVNRTGRVDGPVACVVGAMRGWRTPFRPAEPVTVEYPFSFTSSL